MPIPLNYTIEEEDGLFIARCVELDIASDGLTREEAFANLKEALDCYFANPDERLDRWVAQAGEDEDGDDEEDGDLLDPEDQLLH